MEAWKKAVKFLSKTLDIRVYPDSVHTADGCTCLIAKVSGKKTFLAMGKGAAFSRFEGRETDTGFTGIKLCSLSNKNSEIAREIFPFAAPVSSRGKKITLGLGDRLGMASPGHIRLLKGKPVFPVLAQQSIRELNLTGKKYEDVLAAATWAVIQEGYTGGYGADGDHLKTPEEIQMALDAGFTMITLDCSDHIDNDAASLDGNELEKAYFQRVEKEDRSLLEKKYAGKSVELKDGTVINIGKDEFRRTVLVYLKAVLFAGKMYNEKIKGCGRDVDFEMSIDETLTPTAPAAHYFVASELTSHGVEISTIAPRFCGEFQKGIDYRGDKQLFKGEFTQHFSIAEHFGYRISVHSGSDKFTIFPVVGDTTGGKYHLKTAGTNWLEAVRVIAGKNPDLYRRMHRFAVENLAEAKKYYHIYTTPEIVPDIENLSDEELPSLMDIDESRQALHVTYGLILQHKDSSGKPEFRDEFFKTLEENEDEYCQVLEKHIGKHLELLGV